MAPRPLTSQTSDETRARASVTRSLTATVDGAVALKAAFETDLALSRSIVDAVALIAAGRGRVVVSGVGKSGHIGRKIAATLASTGTSAYFVHPTEASHGDLGMVTSDDILLLLSWSGETAELANMLTYAKRFRVPIISLTSGAESVLARNSDVPVVLPKVIEACPHGLAPTTSALLQLAVGDAIAIALLEGRGFSAEDFKVFHPGGKLGAQLMLVGELAHSGEAMPLLPLGTQMSEALIVMTSKGFGVAGVTDGDGKLIGVITDGDLRRHMSPALMQTPVDAVMSRHPRTAPARMLASAALKAMQDQKVTVLFVIDEAGIPTGVLHIHDLLRAGVI